VTPSAARNPAFDLTPAELVTGYLTEAGLLTGPEELRVAFGG
jgi:methylthioribose-1-phosphate isomerase